MPCNGYVISSDALERPPLVLIFIGAGTLNKSVMKIRRSATEFHGNPCPSIESPLKLYGTAFRELTVETTGSSNSKASSVEAWPKQHLLESWLGCKGTKRIPDGVHRAPGNEGLLLLGVAMLRVGRPSRGTRDATTSWE